jgi:uncharacterized protein
MPTRVWPALVGLIVLLLVAVVGLDQWQTRRGESSLFQVSWPLRGTGEPGEPRRPSAGAITQSVPRGEARVAVIVDAMGVRRDVFEALRGLGRPVTLAVLPGLPLSSSIAREASRNGMEVLLDLPMEPYRFPLMDPGPGALLMSTRREEVGRLLARHLDALPGAVGVTNYMGSRLTEDRLRMRMVLEVLAPRGLFLVDAYTSNLSVAYDEAREVGVRAARRQITVDSGPGEGAGHDGWAEVAPWAERRDEVIVFTHGQPSTARLLREWIPRWEARGLRVVPVSDLAR